MALRAFLSDHGVTQAELAAELRLAKPTVSLKISGHRPWFNHEIQRVLAFCRRYDAEVRYEDLFGDPDEQILDERPGEPETVAAGGRG